jgi:hypothetical protein
LSDPIWSRGFARQIAEELGFRVPDGPTGAGTFDFDPEAERIVEEITEAFRYLPAEKVQYTLDFAEFLGNKIKSYYLRLDRSFISEKLREVGDLAQMLRTRYGSDQPADEKDHWTEEDQRDLTRAAFQRLDKEDPYPWEGPEDAQSG